MKLQYMLRSKGEEHFNILISAKNELPLSNGENEVYANKDRII